MTRRIVCAVLQAADGTIIVGPRHFDTTMVHAIGRMNLPAQTYVQGFIDQRGDFLTREEAWVIASDAGQIVRIVPGNDRQQLFSENLY